MDDSIAALLHSPGVAKGCARRSVLRLVRSGCEVHHDGLPSERQSRRSLASAVSATRSGEPASRSLAKQNCRGTSSSAVPNLVRGESLARRGGPTTPFRKRDRGHQMHPRRPLTRSLPA